MAGYWPSSFFACLWTETELRSINSQKKGQRQYLHILIAILTKQTWSIKDFFCYNIFFSNTMQYITIHYNIIHNLQLYCSLKLTL